MKRFALENFKVMFIKNFSREQILTNIYTGSFIFLKLYKLLKVRNLLNNFILRYFSVISLN